jgi:putative component of membrane protein insertase Oxa1/YidC/SpoIIIJ protein YidD
MGAFVAGQLMAGIRAYQRYLSPHKGHGCAYRLQRGHGSGCSGVGLRLIRRHGAWRGLWLLRERLRRCAVAAQALRGAGRRPRVPRGQRGDCDCSLDACCALEACDCGGGQSRRLRHFVRRRHLRLYFGCSPYRWVMRNRHVLFLAGLLAWLAAAIAYGLAGW